MTECLTASHPDSGTAFRFHIDVLVGAGRAAEAQALARKRLERLPWRLAAGTGPDGQNIEAREALLKGIDIRMREQSVSADWYVLGPIAENYGVRDAAVAAYEHVTNEDQPGATVWELTERRLAVLGGRGR